MNKFEILTCFEDERWQSLAGIDESLILKVRDAVLSTIKKEVDNIKCAKHWRQPVESEFQADFQSDWQAQLGGNGDTSGVSRMVLHFLNLDKNFVLNLVLSDDQTVHQLNKQFRNIDRPTNVLSFANIDDPFFDETLKSAEDIELGDVIMAFETLSKEADELEISLKDHFCHLWVHGMLHILGYDHIKDNERLEMEAREVEILKKLGIENPYQE